MKRYDGQRLDDVETAVQAIRSHLARGDLSDGLVFDAVRIRLLEIGEAVKAVSPALLAAEPGIPWKNIAAMRDQLAHRYFDTEHGIVQRWSIASRDSVLCIASSGSLLSIGSVGSVLSVCSIGSALSVLSIGAVLSGASVMSALSVLSVMSWRARRSVL